MNVLGRDLKLGMRVKHVHQANLRRSYRRAGVPVGRMVGLKDQHYSEPAVVVSFDFEDGNPELWLRDRLGIERVRRDDRYKVVFL